MSNEEQQVETVAPNQEVSPEPGISPNAETPADAEIVAPVEPVLPEEKRYTYQPRDEHDRPIGGEQVLKYRTEAELIAKLQEQNVLVLRKLREETRKNRLGIFETGDIPQDAPRYDGPVDFSKKELTPDERVKISRDLLDPEQFDAAADALFEAKVGVKPDKLRETLTNLQRDNENYKAVREVELFMRDNPGFYQCLENGEAIASWVKKRGLAPVKGNFQKAYDTLNAAGAVIQAPTASVEAPVVVAPQNPVIETPSIPSEEPAPLATPTTTARIPTGITRNQSSDAGTVRPVGDDIVYEYQPADGKGNPVGAKRVYKGEAALRAMPSEVYRQRVLKEKGFKEKAAKLGW